MADPRPLITVIIPVHNRPDTIGRAVRSVLQNGADARLDILVVDDGSEDATPDVIRALAAAHPELRAVRQDNQGVTRARNAGLDNLRDDTEIVAFLDSDDVMTRARFARDLPALMGRAPDGRRIEMTYGRMCITDAICDDRLVPPDHAQTYEEAGIQLGCGLYRRSLITRIGRFDEELRQSEDTDYLLRIFEENTPFVQTDTLTQYYLRHAGNMTKRAGEVRKYFDMMLAKSAARIADDPARGRQKPVFDLKLPPEM